MVIPTEVYQYFTNAALYQHAVRGDAIAAQELDTRRVGADSDAGMWYKIYLGHIYEE